MQGLGWWRGNTAAGSAVPLPQAEQQVLIGEWFNTWIREREDPEHVTLGDHEEALRDPVVPNLRYGGWVRHRRCQGGSSRTFGSVRLDPSLKEAQCWKVFRFHVWGEASHISQFQSIGASASGYTSV